MLHRMFAVTEAEAAIIRTAFEQRGELSAAVELRQMFRGIPSIGQARECVRVIAGWKSLPNPTARLALRHPSAAISADR